MRSPPTCSAAAGFDDTSLYQRPSPPRTERTKTAPSTVTTQIVVRCAGASSSRRVSIRTSLASSISRNVSGANEPFTAVSFPGDAPLLRYSTAPDAGYDEQSQFG
jgi:hypothetical protein